MAVGIGLRQVQEALDRKGNAVQQEFIKLRQRQEAIGRQLLDVRIEDTESLRAEREQLKQRERVLVAEINTWRERARKVMRQPGVDGLKAYLKELLELDEPLVTPAVENALRLLDLPPEERIMAAGQVEIVDQTPAGRLIERARTEYDLRSSDPGKRIREAVAFANRPGMALDDAALEEIAAAIEDPDPLVRELAIFTTIQLLRFRALRIADLGPAHEAVERLAKLRDPAVIPVLIEIVREPRTGFIHEGGEVVEKDNSRSRMVALLRLVEWHTPEAQDAILGLRFDRDAHIVKAAERALELFPGRWTGAIKRGDTS